MRVNRRKVKLFFLSLGIIFIILCTLVGFVTILFFLVRLAEYVGILVKLS